MKKRYVGERLDTGCVVVVYDQADEKKWYFLPPRNDIRNHSPDGFEWGYGGSGPAQLSLALLCDCFESVILGEALYQRFKWVWTAHQNGDTWELIDEELWKIVEDMQTYDDTRRVQRNPNSRTGQVPPAQDRPPPGNGGESDRGDTTRETSPTS